MLEEMSVEQLQKYIRVNRQLAEIDWEHLRHCHPNDASSYALVWQHAHERADAATQELNHRLQA